MTTELVAYSRLTPEQLRVAEYLCLPGNGGKTLAELGEMVGVSERSIYRWRYESAEFAEHVRNRTMAHVAAHLPSVMSVLTEKAMSGHSIKATEVWLRANGLLNPEVHVTAAKPAVDPRSTQAILDSIERLERELEESTNE